jgi:hypothetical protein
MAKMDLDKFIKDAKTLVDTTKGRVLVVCDGDNGQKFIVLHTPDMGLPEMIGLTRLAEMILVKGVNDMPSVAEPGLAAAVPRGEMC